jgi:hypothetical protein
MPWIVPRRCQGFVSVLITEMKLEHTPAYRLKTPTHKVVDLNHDDSKGWWSFLRTMGAVAAFVVSLGSGSIAYLAWKDGVEQGQKFEVWQAKAAEDGAQIRNGVLKIAGLAEAALAEAKRRPDDTGRILAQLARQQSALARQLTTPESASGAKHGTKATWQYVPLDPGAIVKKHD